MAGIYIHIPFCRQKCHYCNFYSLASIKHRDEFLVALLKEIKLQKDYLGTEEVNTIYFGGGTPSLLSNEELKRIFDALSNAFNINSAAEITLEANPDDLDLAKLKELKNSAVNRLSIGIQSFRDQDLNYLNRIHSSQQARLSVLNAQHVGFDNISLDLIYGIPGMSDEDWQSNLETFFSFDVPHLSAYALTVEPKTALDVLIRKKKMKPVDEQTIVSQFQLLVKKAIEKDFVHYEISNFCKVPFFSAHNKNYWFRQTYLGLGPSAHSFSGSTRQWNVSSVSKYSESIQKDKLPFESESLSIHQQYNEYVMTSLRTLWGADIDYILLTFGMETARHFQKFVNLYIKDGRIIQKENIFTLSDYGKLFADGIASELFL
ncbi:MAG: radical SAM family heme chaperone HemW [Bacteroidales bacterium]